MSISGTAREWPAQTKYGYSLALTDAEVDGVVLNLDILVNCAVQPDIKPGDKAECIGRVAFIKEERRLFYLSEGIGYSASAANVRATPLPTRLRFAPARIAGRMGDSLAALYGEQHGLIQGMLLGDKSELDEYIYEAFSVIGTAHILAVSGLHMGFIVAMAAFAARGLNAKLRFVVVTIALWMYCFVVGMPSSAVRACIMATCVLAADLLGEKNDMLSSMSLAALIILAASPAQLFRAGFLMSFSAVLGIAFFARTFARALKLLPGFLSGSLSISAAAQLGIAPVLMAVFNTVQPVAILANLLIVPMAGIVTMGALVSVPVHMVLPAAASPIAWVVQGVARAMNIVAVRFAALPFAGIEVRGMSALGAVAAMAMLFFLSPYYLRKGRRRLPEVLVCTAIIVASFLF